MGMTADDIREQYSMMDVVGRYGLKPNRAGFIHCPFHHGDHTASLKLYKKDFHCFGCQAHGDVIKFVMLMDNCTWKEAFKSLGGESGRLSDAAIMRMAKRKRDANRHKMRLESALKRLKKAAAYYHCEIEIISRLEPFSDSWCSAYNTLPCLEQEADAALTTYLDILSEGK